MDYIELHIPLADPERQERLIAELADFPFEGFEQADGVLKAYIPMEALAGCKEAVDAFLAGVGASDFNYIHLAAQNWNALWESNFEPVEVDERLRIRAPFHAPKPAGMEVVIMPKMSFGTGHHATTRLMAAALLDMDVTGKRGLDMGSGTGVLAIVAALRGAVQIDAVDNDAWAHENALENIAANGVADRVRAQLGDARSIAGKRYDFILANINLNVLLADLPAYVEALETGGALVMSGILASDAQQLKERAESLGLTQTDRAQEGGWVCISFEKR